MDEIEVEDIDPKPLHAAIKTFERGIQALISVPELGRDEHILAGNTGSAQALAHSFLILIDRSGIDMAIAVSQGSLDDRCRGGRWRLEDTEAELRHGVSVAQHDIRFIAHGSFTPRTRR